MSTPNLKPITESKEAVLELLLESWEALWLELGHEPVSLETRKRDWLRRYREAS